MAETVEAKVASGEYATESEVIRDGLRALRAGMPPSKTGCATRSPKAATNARPIRASAFRRAPLRAAHRAPLVKPGP
jgi:Arc/MetJ-type ribon-helix-helix transcriptional regulator